jgi:hypothetical protein
MRLKNKTWTNPQIKSHKKCHERISPQVTVMGFKMFCTSNVVGRTGVDMLRNGSEDEGTDCEEGDSDSDTHW